jgi:hypothetical protein
MTSNKEEIIKTFFDLNKDCPRQIKNCSKLREEYKLRLARLNAFNACTDCNLTELKVFMINQFKYIV